LFVSCIASAQKFTVLNKKTGEPIFNVTAHNSVNSSHSVSDINGILDVSQFKNIETIYFQHLSYLDFKSNKKALLKSKKIYLTPKATALEEVFLSASKKKVKRSRIAQEISTFTHKDIIKSAPQTAADMLSEIPGIKVQKSQFGGGSPVLRGMEANRVLLVIDGVRMNNAIYRKGHLQNSISISPNMLERTEIVFGPSSVIYGSDALGGVIHYYTKQPKLNKTLKILPSFLARYSTVNNEITANAAVEVQTKKIGLFTSISRSEFGDLKMGGNRSHGYENWGLQAEYSDNTDNFYNANSVINDNPEKQKNIGFSQWDFIQKLFIPISNKTDLNVNFQYSQSSDIPRFDKLTQRLSDGKLKFAEWKYGPQKRFLASSQLKINPNKKWVKNGTITLAYQNIKESRVQRKFNSLERSYRNEGVDVFSINVDLGVPLSKKNNRVLSYGTEFTYNSVYSSSKGKTLQITGNKVTGFTNDFIVQTRYPDSGSNYMSSAFYADYRQDISRRETLNTGIRFTNTVLNAKWNDNTYIVLPNNNINIYNSAVTATIGYVCKPIQNIQLNTVISSGFRSPNIDDIGKIREKSGFVSVPNINLKPEHVYNAEIGVIKYFNHKKSNLSFTTYYTLLNNYITREAFNINGSSTIIYDGETVNTIANVNKGTAYIYGGTISFNGKITKYFYGKAATTYTKGKAYDTGAPLSSIPPLFGVLEFGYAKNKWETSLNYKFNAKKKFADYNLIEGIDNIEQTPLNNQTGEYDLGNPAWKTFNFDLKYKISKKIDVLLNVDNIFDQHYKEFASSISAPGRNFSFSVINSF